MQRQSVDSSTLSSAGYDPLTQTLEVEFTSGSIYQYFEVPPRIYDELMRASSKGSYLGNYISDRFQFSRIS
ncbi:MAG: KTSC domain-containing protein [Candidatus Binataceae bacterium]